MLFCWWCFGEEGRCVVNRSQQNVLLTFVCLFWYKNKHIKCYNSARVVSVCMQMISCWRLLHVRSMSWMEEKMSMLCVCVLYRKLVTEIIYQWCHWFRMLIDSECWEHVYVFFATFKHQFSNKGDDKLSKNCSVNVYVHVHTCLYIFFMFLPRYNHPGH